ncbi:FISUMP domain-containing protein [Pararhodonellum marinum]|uniref:FISUMP domain-containing protein n=1 Tax=Pararhodonellum marinum TaxID=2755358 RepID=UPI0018901547|nr:FISUMP domain-containing protein [Pararhodonellum marinum]
MKTSKIEVVARFIPIILLSGMLIACEKEIDDTQLPTVTTVEIIDFLQTNATSESTITSNGGSDITERGVSWSTSQNPTIDDSRTIDGSGEGDFLSEITGLEPNTKYYLRAYATNVKGTAYGDEISFTTLRPFPEPGSTVSDFDNHIYRPLVIGRQVWLTENLKTAHFNNGEPIIQEAGIVDDAGSWDFDDDPENGMIYGKLYNHFAVTDERGICPDGYRIPTEEEWFALIDFLGGNSIAGGKLKYPGLEFWSSPNADATNESGFSAYGAGFREIDGSFQGLGGVAYFWSSTAVPTSLEASSFVVGTSDPTAGRFFVMKRAGFSVRCIMEPYDAED